MPLLHDFRTKTAEKTMNYEIKDNKITVPNTFFDAKSTLFSGQAFRIKELAENKWLIPSKDLAAIVEVKGDVTEISSEDPIYFAKYFDLDANYGEYFENLKDGFALGTISSCPSLKIMRQEKFETVIDFIMSANNNIKRFSKTLDKIAEKYGEKKTFENVPYYAFPSAEVLSKADVNDLKAFGCGYRDRYVIETSKKIAEGFDLEKVSSLDTLSANKYLCALSGIGEKVADCILLFAYQKYDAFPVDTWMEKVYRESYGGKETDRKKIRRFFVDMFGDKAGIIQQYLFYSAREK